MKIFFLDSLQQCSVGRDLVDVKCIGWADKEAQTPLQVDHIFRVFSNTKLVTSYAALLLFEEGRLQRVIRLSSLFRSSRTVVCCAPMRLIGLTAGSVWSKDAI
jgi:hypothetical protein